MQKLRSKVKDLPDVIMSAFLVESAGRFRDKRMSQLLDPQSAMNVLLTSCRSFIYSFTSSMLLVHLCFILYY